MSHYQISSPRKAFAVAAVAMTAITIGLSVVIPATILSDARDERTVAPTKAVTPARVEVAASRLHVHIVGTRDPELISVQVRSAPPKRKQES